jgi:putative PEP-CTERM system histidine kinase
MDSVFAPAGVWSYSLALVAYTAFTVRIALGLGRGARARLLLGAVVATALWAALCLPLALAAKSSTALAASIADSIRYAAWFAFLGHLLYGSEPGAARIGWRHSAAFVSVVAVLVASVLFGEGFAAVGVPGIEGPRAGFLLRVGLVVFGLILVEQLIRRVQPQFRWGIKPLALALGGVFALDLFFYADALLYTHFDPDIWAARGLANVIIIPFLAVATARNTGWTVDLHLSRGAVFHSTALFISGAFLLLVAGAGYFVRYLGGSWGRALQIELLFGAALAVVLVGSSGRFRAKLKVFISKHFFSYRYDYREEWLRFTRTLSTEVAAQSIQERTVMALADLVESPGGALWLEDETRGYVQAARWNMPASNASEPFDAPLPVFLRRTGWIVHVSEARATPGAYADLCLPEWLTGSPTAWLVVPLIMGSELTGFVVLAAPRTVVTVDWEVRDLLKTASRQAASYLGHTQVAEALLEARKFDAFNRMSAFVVHDLKNLVAQLSLMLRNAQRHRDNPAFQADMLETVQHVVGRMNALMLQLRHGTESSENVRNVDIDAIVRGVCAAKRDARVMIDVESPADALAAGHEQRLEHVMGHLIQNAIDASPAGSVVSVRVEPGERFVTIVVADRGEGMTQEFVRDRLFKPFQTTKASGMGIGVYESARYVRSLGGEIQVDSRPGSGTSVRVLLPRRELASEPAAIASETVA